MVDKQDILSLYRIEGKSLREISRELQLHRATVTKIVREYEQSLQSDNTKSLDDVLSSKPRYPHRKGTIRVMTEAVTSEIDYWLEVNKTRKLRGMHKQVLNAKDIHRELLNKGLQVSYASVCRYITRETEKSVRKTKDVFIRQEYPAGKECEFDWGEVKLEIAGVPMHFMIAVFTLCHSNGRYAYLFRHQDTLALMKSHRNFFKDVQGVPETMVYDNMRVAVRLTDTGKQPTVVMQRLSNFYRFRVRYCNARAGWEKGHVERSVEIVRGRAFKSRVEFNTIEEAQTWLTEICSQLNNEASNMSVAEKRERLQEDRVSLQPYPGEMGCFELVECSVDKESIISYKNSHYSVPDHLSGSKVLVQVYSEKIVVYDSKHQKVAVHERSYNKGEWRIDINHYMTTLMKKPGALEGSTALKQMPTTMQRLYHVHFKDKGREYLQLLQFAREYGYSYEDIISALQEVRRRGVKKVTVDQLKVALYAMKSSPAISKEVQEAEDYLEISIGSEDILNQLTTIMGE